VQGQEGCRLEHYLCTQNWLTQRHFRQR